MKFSIGYQLPDERDSTLELVQDYREQIGEVYYALPGEPSGRPPVDPADEGEMFRELGQIASLGVRMVLLLNASCYGEDCTSPQLAQRLVERVRVLDGEGLAGGVTVASPFLALRLKEALPGVECRASVNMRLGSEAAFSQLEGYFDSFYLQRDLNRSLSQVKQAREWCRRHGKGLHLLVNSGCLRYCGFQSLHDNYLSHVKDIPAQSEAPAYCWNYLERPEHRAAVLGATWIRPEDLFHYEGLADGFKLATRTHANPRMVVEAYVRGKFRGNLLELMEPGYAPLFFPQKIDNTRFPKDWFERVTDCTGRCQSCGYCERTLQTVLSDYEG